MRNTDQLIWPKINVKISVLYCGYLIYDTCPLLETLFVKNTRLTYTVAVDFKLCPTFENFLRWPIYLCERENYVLIKLFKDAKVNNLFAL